MQNTIKFHPYLIECHTNLHVGSGNNNYGIIDKQVQRDSISKVPIIHASSLKGALREYFEEVIGWKESVENEKKLTKYFGSDKGETETLSQGKLRFMEARLLSIPVRGTQDKPFYHASSNKHIEAFNLDCKRLGVPLNMSTKTLEVKVNTEYEKVSLFESPSWLGTEVVDMDDKFYKEVLKSLPNIARNSLENGQSENLWYEEFVPRESRFYFYIGVPNDCKNYVDEFEEEIDGKIVQIGANATVGYGYCKISKMKES